MVTKKYYFMIFLIAFAIMFNLLLISAVWYNPLTWFDDNGDNHITTVEKGGITKIYNNNQKNLKLKDKIMF